MFKKIKSWLQSGGFAIPVAVVFVYLLVSLHHESSSSASTLSPSTYTGYVPIYVSHSNETYNSGGATPVLDLTYVKQDNQVDFMVCANIIGNGSWLLAYPEAGDPAYFNYPSYTWTCLHTPTGTGGGTNGFPLQLFLSQGIGTNTVHMKTPNIFVSTGSTITQITKP